MRHANQLTTKALNHAVNNSEQNAGVESTAEPWVDELLAKLHAIYGQKWSNHVSGIPYEALRQTWAEALNGWTKAQAKQALDVCARRMHWPPAVPDFVTALDDGSNPEQRAFARQLAADDEAQRSLPRETWAETRERGRASLKALKDAIKGAV
jgi:hypothetical protein